VLAEAQDAGAAEERKEEGRRVERQGLLNELTRRRPKLDQAAPVLVVWLLLAAWTNLPFGRAAISPPPGRAFVGTFHWIDDFYNYVSYVQQAEDGRFFFYNKLDLAPRPARLVNLEWWTIGRLSAALGGRPFLAYRMFGLVASLALLVAVDRGLSRAGLLPSHRFGGLLLVATGGGLGGVLFQFTDRPVGDALDLSTGIFPFLGLLANPHFTAGTALLLSSLLAFEEGRSWWGAALGTLLAFVRPYDVAVLGATRVISVGLLEPPRRWLRALVPLLGVVPALAYDAWVIFGDATFASFRGSYVFPPLTRFAWALGPAVAVASLGPRPSRADAPGRTRAHLWVWVAIGVTLILGRPEGFSLQFLAGLGAPLLMLGALGLARWRPAATALAAFAFASTAFVATRIVLVPDPHWFVPRELLEAAEALRSRCRAHDVVYAPSDISLYTVGRTACRAAVAHEMAPGFAEREQEMALFYREMSPEARRGVLDRLGITLLALPGDAGPRPVAWLGEASGFAKAASVVGPIATITWYARESPTGSPVP
jgi:hypothetical protein